MQTISVFQVDLWDGGDRHNFGFYIDSSKITEQELKKKDPHCLVIRKTITVFDSLEEKEANSVANLRKSAFAKLTPQERDAIGLKI